MALRIHGLPVERVGSGVLKPIHRHGHGLSIDIVNCQSHLTGLRQTLDECRRLARQVLDRKPKPLAEGEGASAEGGAAPASGGGPSMGTSARNRAEVDRQLAQAADVLRQLEPHSPIPYLIERAVALGNLSFPDLIKVLVRDATVLGELTREFGIEAPPQ